MCLFEYYIAIFLVMPGKPSFSRLDFNVGLRYRKCFFREETSRCLPVIKHLDVDFKGLGPVVLAVSEGGCCLDTFLSPIVSLFVLPLSGRRLGID